MKLTVLGSGTCIPSKERGSSGYLLEIKNNLILIDCGNGTTWKLEKIGVDYLEIDHIFITHFHPDHTSDLIPFLFATKNSYDKTRTKTLTIWGPEGLREFLNNLFSVFGDWIVPEYLKIKEIEDDTSELKGFNVSIFKTLHTDNSIGYIFSDRNKKLIYTGDTGYFDELSDISSNADFLIIECSLPELKKTEKHLSPGGIIKIVNNAKPKTVLLTHLYPDTEETIKRDLIESIDSDSEIIIAKDLMRITI